MQGEYYNSEEQMFWEGHLIQFEDEQAAKNYAATYGRDVGFCSTCNHWVDRLAHFDRDGACLVSTASSEDWLHLIFYLLLSLALLAGGLTVFFRLLERFWFLP